MKISTVRRVLLALVFVAICVGIVLKTGTGTLSTFGWYEVASLCPLGALEAFLATRTLAPRLLIVFIIMIMAGAVFGKAFCSWLCPVVPLRSLASWLKGKRNGKNTLALSSRLSEAKTEKYASLVNSESGTLQKCLETSSCDTPASCDSCVQRRAKLDSRHLVLGGALLSTAIFGFPVFCLICPVGLTFATITVLVRLFEPEGFSAAFLVFPLILILEVFVLRRWCHRLCPLGALASLLALPNRFFRPRVDKKKCLRTEGGDCRICADSCYESLDPHVSDGMHECNKCGLCKDKCPAQAISIPFYTK